MPSAQLFSHEYRYPSGRSGMFHRRTVVAFAIRRGVGAASQRIAVTRYPAASALEWPLGISPLPTDRGRFRSNTHSTFSLMNPISFFKHWKQDLPASVVVFLVTVPLCLGISLASGAPPITGLIAGIIGGIVVGGASGSHLGVSGPATGLAIIVAGAIGLLGLPSFLVALVLAGAMQLVLGLFGAGIIAYYFPNSVIKGMLTSIGILIIAKQIPHAFGYDKDEKGNISAACKASWASMGWRQSITWTFRT